MKGRKLSLQEVLNLEDGTKVWVEDNDEGDKQIGIVKQEGETRVLVDDSRDILVTQLFFDIRLYFDFLDRCAQMNINCPVIPGIMPIFNARIKTMTARSGCSIPANLVLMIDKYQDSPEDLKKAGEEYAAYMIRELLDGGAPGIHLYTMNKLESTKNILKLAGLR